LTVYASHVDLRRLHYFLVVAEELNYSRAARRLSIAGPSLSQQIKTLERELKTQLFERDRRSVQLTAAGAALIPDARALVSQADELVRRAGQATSQKQIRFGLPSRCPASAAEQVSMMASVNVDSWVMPSHFQAWRVASGNLDMAICHIDNTTLKAADLDAHLVAADQLHAICVGSDPSPAEARDTVVLTEADWMWWSWNHFAEEFARSTGAAVVKIDDGGIAGPAFYEHARDIHRPILNAPMGPTDPLAGDMTRRELTEPAPLWTWSLVHRRGDKRLLVRELVDALTTELAPPQHELDASWLPRDDPHLPES
jgi:DNA-binding transcriptional LysR family regulator